MIGSDMKKVIIIGLIISLLIIIGMFVFFSEFNCNPYPYTFILSQTALDSLGEEEKAENPYKISCNELKYSYCTDHIEGSYNSNTETCDNNDINITCLTLVRYACNNYQGDFDTSNTCRQKDIDISNIREFEIKVVPPLVNVNGVVKKDKDFPDC